MASFAQAATPTCRAAIESARQILSNRRGGDAPPRKPVNLSSWKDTPELYRRMVANVAGVPDAVHKIDRELTETEKVMLRSAIADLRMVLGGLVSL